MSKHQSCPKCGQPLKELCYPDGSMLNREQWESVRAGDLWCSNHAIPYYAWRDMDRPENAKVKEQTYYEIRESIKNAPTTWLPALLMATAGECVSRKVFAPGGLARVVANIESEAAAMAASAGKAKPGGQP